mmetsp:Transcript_25951/g.59989  ORF Transcript_25951/g.59989 Transcript_25951/m.59989 type:complete len:196 (+) Transcript_25951:68-655(+)
MEDLGNDQLDSGDAFGPPAAGGGQGRGPRPRAQMGGWGFGDDGDGATGGTVQAQPVATVTTTESSIDNSKRNHFDGEDEAVPTIPDLEEEAEEDITRQVAAPPTAGPSYSAQPVRAVRELDVGSRGAQLPASPEEGVDLVPLMQCLCAEKQVFETDVAWDHELIFQEVASAINADLTTTEEGAAEDLMHEPNFGG